MNDFVICQCGIICVCQSTFPAIRRRTAAHPVYYAYPDGKVDYDKFVGIALCHKAKTCSFEEIVHIVSHETIHIVLSDIDGERTSLRLDTPLLNKESDTDPSGLPTAQLEAKIGNA